MTFSKFSSFRLQDYSIVTIEIETTIFTNHVKIMVWFDSHYVLTIDGVASIATPRLFFNSMEANAYVEKLTKDNWAFVN